MISLLIKFVLIVVGLGVGAVVVMQSMGGTNVLGGLTSKTTTTDAFQERLDVFDAVSKVLPAVTDIPSLEPIIKTTGDVQRTLQNIKDLPAQERAALCEQVCSP